MTDQLPEKRAKKGASRTLRLFYLRTLRFFIGTRRRIFITLGVLVLVALGFFLWHRNQPPSSAQMVAELSKVMLVPQEQPEIATVTDASTLKTQQPFYADVTNGDVLFVFPLAGKAILFRPRTHQIVNAGPINTPPAATKK